VETLERDWILSSSLRQEFQRNGLLKPEIVGSIHLAHASATQEGNDSIAFGKHRSRNEAALIGGAAGSR
jgi:hypothetical protein